MPDYIHFVENGAQLMLLKISYINWATKPSSGSKLFFPEKNESKKISLPDPKSLFDKKQALNQFPQRWMTQGPKPRNQ